MVNSVELMQLCRLCLVKDQVNIPIFNNETDVQQIFLKISTCLPVKVAQDDKLPKKICGDCSYKLDMCYQFWNSSANSEKQLITWLNEVGLSQESLNEAKLQKTESNQAPPGLVLKQEAIEPESESSHEVANNVSTESQEYILQQQQLPYQTSSFPFSDDNYVSGEAANAGASKAHTNNKREATLKRKRQAAATVTQPDSDDDVDEEIDDPTETKVAKTEETSDDDRDDDGLNDEEESTEFAGVPSTSTDNEQPGPSGIGKNVVDAPFEDVRIKNECIIEDSVLINENALKLESSLSNHFYKCNLCELTWKHKETVRTHMQNHHKKPASICSQCLTVFEDKYACRRHQRKVHPRKCLPCKYCNRLFDYNFNLKKHMEMHEDRRRVMKCDVCEKKFVTKMGLKSHVESHTGQNVIACNLCGKKIYKRCLKRHMENMHSNGMSFTCNLCSKTFRYETSYKSHLKKHLPDYKPPCYECNECGSKFSNDKSIAKHKKEHQEEKRYIVCELCGKALTNFTSLRRHLLVHKGEKPHTCEVCGKSFTAKSTLKMHKFVHTKEKPYVCRVCDKGFTQPHSLKFHMRSIHTHEKPYKCTVCEKTFVSKTSMNAHVKSHGVCS